MVSWTFFHVSCIPVYCRLINLTCVDVLLFTAWYEPTCVEKAAKSVIGGCHSQLSYTSPSLSELRSMVAALTGQEVQGGVTAGHLYHVQNLPTFAQIFIGPPHPPTHTYPPPHTGLSVEEKFNECRQLCPSLLPHIPNVLVSLGRDGLVYARRGEKRKERGSQESNGGMELLHYPPAASHLLPVSVVSVTGAGDRCGKLHWLVRLACVDNPDQVRSTLSPICAAKRVGQTT